jgi:hypothetical protein
MSFIFRGPKRVVGNDGSDKYLSEQLPVCSQFFNVAVEGGQVNGDG